MRFGMSKQMNVTMVAVLMSAAGAIAGTPVPTITPLGVLPGESSGSIPQAISDDGTTITGDGVGFSGSDEAYRWTDALGIVSLDVADDGITASKGLCVSADGSVIAGWYGSSPNSGFYWTETTGMVTVPGVSAGGCRVQAISADGQILAGTYAPTTSSVGGRWMVSTASWTPLDGARPATDTDADGNVTSVWDCSADGSVVVGSWFDVDLPSAQRSQACRWSATEGTLVLPMLGTSPTQVAYGVSADGNTIVGETSNTVAFRWTSGEGTTSLGFLAGHTRSSASAVSANGLVAVGYSRGNSSSSQRAFVWDAINGMRDIRQVLIDAGATGIADWSELIEGHDVSADGRYITGRGRFSGSVQGFIVDLGVGVTEPACAADFNNVNGVTVQDIFDFLTAWLAGSATADFNNVNGVTVQDIFDFLTAWLAGC